MEKKDVLAFYKMFFFGIFFQKNTQKYLKCIFELYNKFMKYIRTWSKLKNLFYPHI
jgi:hypothetical protein